MPDQKEIKSNRSHQILTKFSKDIINCLYLFVPLLILISCHYEAKDQLASDFQDPPSYTKPWLYWYWIDENISKEGITRDLEAMARVGIGQALIGHVSPGGQRGNVKILSNNWWKMVEHAVSEGQRLGVDIGFFNGPGWSQSGGPWIKKNQAMRHIVSHEIQVSGPSIFKENISPPDSLFELVALQAIPIKKDLKSMPDPQIKSIVSDINVDRLNNLFDNNKSTHFIFPASLRNERDLIMDLYLDNPQTIHAIQFDFLPVPFKVQIDILIKEPNGDYSLLRSFMIDRRYINFEIGPMRYQPAAFSLPEINTDQVRIRLSNLTSDFGAGLREIQFKKDAVVDQVIEKQLGKMYSGPLPPWDGYLWDDQNTSQVQSAIDPQKVIDLTSRIDANGNLNWEVPEGDWIILQSGMVPTGATNVPVPPEATGFECDKFTIEAIETHFDGFIGNFLERVPPEKRTSLKTVVIDSYEVGPQNWTGNFREIFQDRYGYDPIPWMPVFSGRIVENTDKSDRFLWDVRRLTADLISDVYVNRLREMCNEQGLELWLENYGHWGFPAEFLQYGGRADKVSGEFWYENHLWDLGPLECRAASSAAHIYGKNQVFAEAFTAGFNFQQYPASMKSRGDQMFCEGINHMVQHVYIHQPWEDRIPGVIAWFGMSYQRHNTWFEQSRAWNEYLSRCHFMLQQGLPVTDICYFIGEDAPKMTGILEPGLPDGYDYDFINSDVIMTRLSVNNGLLSLPDGKTYELMVLPPLETMRPELIKKIKELLMKGARIYGPPPIKSPSLENYPSADKEVHALSKEIWKDLEEKPEIYQAVGKGQLFYGQHLSDVLDKLEVEPDVIVQDTSIRWIHRRKEGIDIYFISNQEARSKEIEISFRIEGKIPEIWDPAIGEMYKTAYFKKDEGRIILPLNLDVDGSAFVVFRETPEKEIIQKVKFIETSKSKTAETKPGIQTNAATLIYSEEGKIILRAKREGNYTLEYSDMKKRNLLVSEIPHPLEFDNPWIVRFPANWDTPNDTLFDHLISWSDHQDEGIRHFSGTATYFNQIEIPENMIGPDLDILLDLGDVMVMAEIIVNGQNLGILWKKPFAIDITRAIHEGSNEIEIRITNTWWNRLVGDEKYPEGFPGSNIDQPRTFTTYKAWKANDDLMLSGLMGPVKLYIEKQYNISKEF